jgi:DNA-binding CsgD family transcriptional regulator
MYAAAELFDRFSGLKSADDRWDTALELVTEFGGNSLSVAVINGDNPVPSFFRSTMDERWLAQYIERNLVIGDPLPPHSARSRRPLSIRGGTLRASEARNPQALELNHSMTDMGYQSVLAVPFDSDLRGSSRVVVFSSDLAFERHFTGEVGDQLALLTMVFNAYLFTDAESSVQNAAQYGGAVPALSQREHDVLLYLALGLKTQRIAERLQLAEVTVRKYFQSARQKLGARTREQALARAICGGLISF